MQAFRFPLGRALAWRRAQLELEENKLRQIVAAREEMALEKVRLDLVKDRAEQAVRDAPAVEAGDLWALAAYRQRLIAEGRALEARRQTCEQHLESQRQRVVEAQRGCRLLEKLLERRRAQWRQESDRELENLAAESYLAGWSRRGP